MTQIITDDVCSPKVPSSGPKSQRVCRHFARGRCTWGASCRFSHDMDRAAMEEPHPVSQATIAERQQRIQKDRHAILKCALDGDFDIKPYDVVDGFQRHIVQIRISSTVIPIRRLYTEEALQQHLIELEGNDQLRIGGLLFLVGEPAVFWSMMHLYRLRRTTTHAGWDALLANAKRGSVECMFFRSTVGCLCANCPFIHSAAPAVSVAAPLQYMATNNALLTPLLGFGSIAPPAQKSVSGGMRIPPDPTRNGSTASFSPNKAEDPVVFRDPVWGTCAIPEIRTAASAEAQEIMPSPWDGGLRVVADPLW